MKILILGAGQVGASVASALTGENNDITVIDSNPRRLEELSERLDLRTFLGHASLPSVLEAAGANDAELMIAVTSSDEVNLIACQVADALFKTPTKIARVRRSEYFEYPELVQRRGTAVDVAISPEQLVCTHVQRLIEYPGAMQVLDFAQGKVQMVAVRTIEGGILVGKQIAQVHERLPPGIDMRVAAIYRCGKPISPKPDTEIEVDDEVFFLVQQRDIRAVMEALRPKHKPVRRILIAGGGNIGVSLAKALEERYGVKLLERNRERTPAIAESLQSTIVLVGDCTDEDLLREENIDQTDIFCALTNDDESNILSAMLAKRMGCPRVIALINRPAYAELVEGDSSIDIAVSPQQVTLGALLTYVRLGSMVRVHSLRRGMAEAIEAVAVGDARTSRVIGRALEDLELPASANVVGVIRGERLLIAHHDVTVEPDDHLIVFLHDKRELAKLEALFRADATWF
ncbi:MAG TPA: Trk system potassium transporter TrkA [Chiayiivirga sp.]|nr:Trk system potassium transporter TrkA [Chiayiivirga sp.]